MQKRPEMLPPALPRDVPNYHERQASHCRALAASAPSPELRARLLAEAEKHERIACDEPGAESAGEMLR